MTGWFKSPKNVRLHLLEGEPSFEGILIGKPAGHYRLINAKVLDGEEAVAMDGEAFVPKERVLFVQVLS